MPRRQVNTSAFGKKTNTPTVRRTPASQQPSFVAFKIPDDDDEDPTLREAREEAERAAQCLQVRLDYWFDDASLHLFTP